MKKMSLLALGYHITGGQGTAPRVLHVVWSNAIGGVQRRVAAVADRLRAVHGIPSSFLVPDEPGPFTGLLQRLGFSYRTAGLLKPLTRGAWHQLVAANVRYGAKLIRLVPALARLIRDMGVDIVHVNGLLGLPAVVAARVSGKPVVWHLIGNLYPATLIRLLGPVIRHCGAEIVLVTRRLADYYGVPRAKVIREPVDERFVSLPRNRWEAKRFVEGVVGRRLDLPVIVAVGNVNPAKGYEYLIAALSRLYDEVPRFMCLIVGAVPAHREAYAASLKGSIPDKLRDRILFLGYQDDVLPFLDAADVFVQASLREGTPVAILEAMARALPVVATRVGGVPEQLSDGREGVLVSPGNTEELALALHTVLGNPVWARELGERARRKVMREYTLDQCVKEHAELYYSLASRSSRG